MRHFFKFWHLPPLLPKRRSRFLVPRKANYVIVTGGELVHMASSSSSLDEQIAAELALATTSLKVLNISCDAVARLVGDDGSNIDKVREATGAEVEVEAQDTREGQEEQTTTLKIRLKGSGNAVRNAFRMIELLLKRHNLLIGEIAGRVLAPQLNSPPKQFVREAIEKREKVHPSGQILFLDRAVPWKKPYFELERELDLGPAGICLAVFKVNTDGKWRVEAMPQGKGKERTRRILLPWKGLQGAELEAESGIQGAYFVQFSGFLGGAKTIEAAMEMAEHALSLNGWISGPSASAPPAQSLPKCASPSDTAHSEKLQGDDAAAKHIVRREAIKKRKKAKISEKLRNDAHKHIVRQAFERRKKIHPSGKILFLDGVVPWKRAFFELEKQWAVASAGICLAIYKFNPEGNWLVEAISKEREVGHNKRILLPWKGLEDAELEAESGIRGALFVDPSGFIGVAKTIEAALEMAEQTLKLNG